MATTKTDRRPATGPKGRPKRNGLLWAGIAAGIVAVLVAVILFITNRPPSTAEGQAQPAAAGYAVGNPGPGAEAPGFSLPSTSGSTLNLSDYRGQSVLLYFHEGLGCQPCWDQLRDIEARWGDFQALGIDRIVSITSDPLDVLEGKVALEGLDTPLLSDPGVEVSRTYEANLYTMMGNTMNGHSFVIVGPDGVIEWRADYGGPPDYTMYLPVDALLGDITNSSAVADRTVR